MRLCGPQDIPALVEFTRQGYDEGAGFLPFDQDKVAWWLARAIGKHLVIVAETDAGTLMGALALDDEAPRYSSAVALWDIGFYVLPQHRRSRAAAMLRDAAKAIAADMGLPLFLGVMSGVDLDRKAKFFTRGGFRPVGAVYLWKGGVQ